MALPHGAVGWYAVCDWGIFLIILTYFLFFWDIGVIDQCAMNDKGCDPTLY